MLCIHPVCCSSVLEAGFSVPSHLKSESLSRKSQLLKTFSDPVVMANKCCRAKRTGCRRARSMKGHLPDITPEVRTLERVEQPCQQSDKSRTEEARLRTRSISEVHSGALKAAGHASQQVLARPRRQCPLSFSSQLWLTGDELADLDKQSEVGAIWPLKPAEHPQTSPSCPVQSGDAQKDETASGNPSPTPTENRQEDDSGDGTTTLPVKCPPPLYFSLSTQSIQQGCSILVASRFQETRSRPSI